MISTALTLIAATLSMQASDTTRAAREGFTRCLSSFVESSVHANKTLDQFNADYPHACATQEAAFRQAIIQRDMSSRSTRAGAEDAANLEVEDARANFNDRFQMALPPQQVAAAPAAPAAPAVAAPAHPTVAAQPASHSTVPAQPATQPH